LTAAKPNRGALLFYVDPDDRGCMGCSVEKGSEEGYSGRMRRHRELLQWVNFVELGALCITGVLGLF
jgi:hypothetical protein